MFGWVLAFGRERFGRHRCAAAETCLTLFPLRFWQRDGLQSHRRAAGQRAICSLRILLPPLQYRFSRFDVFVDTHDSRDQVLVAEPGGCPHCSPVPAISLPDFRIEKKAEAVRLRGTLSYGFKVDSAGAGSFLRLDKARLT